ncbi:glycine cleavage system aminomethyltransferase GcvT [Micrococcales bacterium 31B]|nr:glycine cleavage system aminomethyltransferase GcvT [Micrococcales bacterium 31B]
MTPQHTALHAEHERLGAIFTDFGGWDMPLKYGSDVAEHRAVREAAGLFDLSHMGEVRVSGADAAVYLNTALAGNLAIIKIGKAKYSFILNEHGGIIDDLIVYRLGETEYLVVPNASNAATVFAAMQERAAGFDVSLVNETEATSLIAVQGPNAEAILLDAVSGTDADTVRDLKYYAWATITLNGEQVLLARTGYTGEDGFEIFLPNASAAPLWRELERLGESHGLVPCGLAARDSLRLEAGMPLYGHELSAEWLPAAAGLGPVVSLKKTESFVGRAAIEAADAPARVLVGLTGVGKRPARGGYSLVDAEGGVIGEVTSGLPSPTLGYPIAMAYVDAAYAVTGGEVLVDLRGKPGAYTVVDLPFYRRSK